MLHNGFVENDQTLLIFKIADCTVIEDKYKRSQSRFETGKFMKIKHDVAIKLESLEMLVVCIIGLHSIVILIIINRIYTYIIQSDSMHSNTQKTLFSCLMLNQILL